MRTTVNLTCAVLLMCAGVIQAQEPTRIPNEEATEYGRMIAHGVVKWQGLKLTLKLGPEQSMGLTADDRGVLLVPQAGLDLQALAKPAKPDEVLPLGVLAMYRVAPTVNGDALAKDKCRTVSIKVNDNEVDVAVMPLGVSRVAGRLVLLAWAKDEVPVLVAALLEADHANSSPVELSVSRIGDRFGSINFGVLGKYRAELLFTATE